MWEGVLITLVWRTDVHLSDTSPISRIDDWAETLLDKLYQVSKIACDKNATAVIDGGDFFHTKSPTKTSHSLIQRVIKLHTEHYKKNGIPVYSCVGNHDCVYGDYAYLPQQPLGVLFESDTFYRLYDEHEALFYDEKEDITVRVVGVPYHGVDYDLSRFESIKKGKEDYLVVVGHVLSSKKGGSMFEGEDILSYNKILDFEGDVFCFGHWHKDQGITEISPGKHIVNIGSLSRGSLSQDHLERIPSIAVLNFSKSGITIEKVGLKVKSVADVFDLAGRSKTEARKITVDGFMGKIKDIFSNTNTKSIPDLIREAEGIPPKVREKSIKIWEESISNR